MIKQDVLRRPGDRFGLLLSLYVVQVRGDESYILILESEGLIQVPKRRYLHLVPLQMWQICRFHSDISNGMMVYRATEWYLSRNSSGNCNYSVRAVEGSCSRGDTSGA